MLAKRYRLPATFFKSQPATRPEKRENDFFTARRYHSCRAYSRFAVVVSKKVAPLAVTRTRLRRLVYEYIRLSGGWARPGGDVVVVIKAVMVGDAAHVHGALAQKGSDCI
jgi:ribonuclease P protein component